MNTPEIPKDIMAAADKTSAKALDAVFDFIAAKASGQIIDRQDMANQIVKDVALAILAERENRQSISKPETDLERSFRNKPTEGFRGVLDDNEKLEIARTVFGEHALHEIPNSACITMTVHELGLVIDAATLAERASVAHDRPERASGDILDYITGPMVEALSQSYEEFVASLVSTMHSHRLDSIDVKPLEWFDNPGGSGGINATTQIGIYSVDEDSRLLAPGVWPRQACRNLEAAKAAAQADFDARIRSALNEGFRR